VDAASYLLDRDWINFMEAQLMTTATVKGTTVGVFDTRGGALRAIADLRASGYPDDQIGLVG
jgi:hypothetical protein